jgi:hypothetical protein
LDWIGFDWIGLDWIGLDWIGLDWIGLTKSFFYQLESEWSVLNLKLILLRSCTLAAGSRHLLQIPDLFLNIFLYGSFNN